MLELPEKSQNYMRDRQTDRQTDGQTDRQTELHERQTDRQTELHERDRQTGREKEHGQHRQMETNSSPPPDG